MNEVQSEKLEELADVTDNAIAAGALRFCAAYGNHIDRLDKLVDENPEFFRIGASEWKVEVAVAHLEKKVAAWSKRYGR